MARQPRSRNQLNQSLVGIKFTTPKPGVVHSYDPGSLKFKVRMHMSSDVDVELTRDEVLQLINESHAPPQSIIMAKDRTHPMVGTRIAMPFGHANEAVTGTVLYYVPYPSNTLCVRFLNGVVQYMKPDMLDRGESDDERASPVHTSRAPSPRHEGSRSSPPPSTLQPPSPRPPRPISTAAPTSQNLHVIDLTLSDSDDSDTMPRVSPPRPASTYVRSPPSSPVRVMAPPPAASLPQHRRRIVESSDDEDDDDVDAMPAGGLHPPESAFDAAARYAMRKKRKAKPTSSSSSASSSDDEHGRRHRVTFNNFSYASSSEEERRQRRQRRRDRVLLTHSKRRPREPMSPRHEFACCTPGAPPLHAHHAPLSTSPRPTIHARRPSNPPHKSSSRMPPPPAKAARTAEEEEFIRKRREHQMNRERRLREEKAAAAHAQRVQEAKIEAQKAREAECRLAEERERQRLAAEHIAKRRKHEGERARQERHKMRRLAEAKTKRKQRRVPDEPALEEEVIVDGAAMPRYLPRDGGVPVVEEREVMWC